MNQAIPIKTCTSYESKVFSSLSNVLRIEVIMNNNIFVKTLSCCPKHQTNKRKKTTDYYLLNIIIRAVKLNRKLKINEHGADCVRHLGNIPLSKHALLDKANKK